MKFYGQFETDKIIKTYFPTDFIGGCIDVGATDGVNINNTLHFEENGWYSLCIEPNPNFFKNLEKNRKHSLKLAISDHNEDQCEFNVVNLNGINEEAISGLKIDEKLIQQHSMFDIKINKILCDVRTLDYCIDNYYNYNSIDFVSIDTEGTELDVLKGFNINKWQPRLLVIENNWNDDYVEKYLEQFGYKKDQRVAVNDFFIKK